MICAVPCSPLIAFYGIGPSEMLLLGIIALLLYGGELPEKARDWGRAFAEFKRGLSGIQNDLNSAIYAEPPAPKRLQSYPEFRDVEPVADASREGEDQPEDGPSDDGTRPSEPRD